MPQIPWLKLARVVWAPHLPNTQVLITFKTIFLKYGPPNTTYKNQLWMKKCCTIRDILFCFKKIKNIVFFKCQWNEKVSSSFHQSHHMSRDRADQNTSCCLPLPGQSAPSQQDKLGHTSCVLHISKFQPETAASPGCPSLPCPPALPAPFCQLGFAAFTLQTEHALFSANTINRCKELEIHESHLCHAGTRLCPSNLGQAGRIRGVQHWDSFHSPFPGAQVLFLIQPWWSCNTSPH